jgi:hypothetical protein
MRTIKNLFHVLLLTLAPVWAAAQLPCIPVTGFNNGGFETFTVLPAPSLCTFDNQGLMTAPFNAGCVSGWFGPNGTPNLMKGINGGFTPVTPPPGSTVFAAMGITFSANNCQQEVIAANVTLDPGAVYELSFKHRKAVNASSTVMPGVFTGQVILTSGLVNNTTHTGLEPCLTFSSKEKIVFSSSNISSTEWVTTTITFNSLPGQNQILFAPTAPEFQNSLALWLVDDIVLRKCQPCKAKFSLLCVSSNCAYSFLNQSTPGSGATVSGFMWTVTALDDPEQPVIMSTDRNFIFQPSCNGRYRVCVTVKDSKGCINEYCEIINVTCTACKCVPGPNPCTTVPPDDSLRRVALVPAISDAQSGSSFKLFPNPAQNSFSINFQNSQSDAPLLIQVFDAFGKVVISRREALRPGQPYSLQTGPFKAGVYLVRISQNSQLLYTERVVITG